MPINKIVIVGGGLAAWMCASACARSLQGTSINIHVVPTDVGNDLRGTDYSLGLPMVVETSFPALHWFHKNYGYDERALIDSTRGGYSHGVAVSDWSDTGDVFNTFGEVGSVLGPVSFLQVGHRVRDLGYPFKFANYSLAALMAQSGRYASPESVGHPAFAVLDHGLQLDMAAYSQAMKADAVARGVAESATFKQANITESGFIKNVVTDANEVVDGDLFVDCSGANGLLRSQVHVEQFVEWSQWMICNRIADAMIPDSGRAQPFAHLIAQPSGWSRIVSLQGRRGELRCVHDNFTQQIDADFKVFTAGHVVAPWQKNCVALGGASAVLDPSMSLSLSWLASGIRRMIDLLPTSPQCMHESIEFNRQSSAEIECARDYIIAHYKLNRRTGNPLWEACRNMDIPDSLQHRIDVYRNCGRVVMRDGEVVDQMNWAILFDAGNVVPLQYDVVARGIPDSLIRQHLDSIRDTFIRATKAAPHYPWVGHTT